MARFPDLRRAVVLAGLSAAVLVRAGPAMAASPSIEGRWLTDDRKALVQIAPCGTAMCGTIYQILDKGRDVPTTDSLNPVRALQSRPLIGLPVLTGFTGDGPSWTGGRAYDPKAGKSYRASLHLQTPDQLVVTGCIFVFCEAKNWTRLAPAARLTR